MQNKKVQDRTYINNRKKPRKGKKTLKTQWIRYNNQCKI